MKDKLKEALDQALKVQVDKLFNVLALSNNNNNDEAVKRFSLGLTNVMVAYGRASLVIDQMTDI